jgi:hypothetical protein
MKRVLVTGVTARTAISVALLFSPRTRRLIRQEKALPILDDLAAFFDHALIKLPGGLLRSAH